MSGWYSWEGDRAELEARPQLLLPKHLGHRHMLAAVCTTWPLVDREESLLWSGRWAHACLLSSAGSGGHGTPMKARTMSWWQINRDRGTSETGWLQPSAGGRNPTNSIKPSLMVCHPKAPEQTLPARNPNASRVTQHQRQACCTHWSCQPTLSGLLRALQQFPGFHRNTDL